VERIELVQDKAQEAVLTFHVAYIRIILTSEFFWALKSCGVLVGYQRFEYTWRQ
jgi:hypothetical protein